jgi:hypothetical protein
MSGTAGFNGHFTGPDGQRVVVNVRVPTVSCAHEQRLLKAKLDYYSHTCANLKLALERGHITREHYDWRCLRLSARRQNTMARVSEVLSSLIHVTFVPRGSIYLVYKFAILSLCWYCREPIFLSLADVNAGGVADDDAVTVDGMLSFSWFFLADGIFHSSVSLDFRGGSYSTPSTVFWRCTPRCPAG